MKDKNRKNLFQFTYRPDLDGLRAIAVLTVVAFHAFPDIVPGGFIGVDVFFVISGFLISSIIMSSLNRGTFKFSDFYARRVRRIFPALALVLITCYVAGWFFLLADEYEQLGKHVAAGASFLSNFILWRESGYFDNSVDTKPLLHLWSLGIEKQFYIVWPLMIWLLWTRRSILLLGLILTFALSFTFNLDLIRRDAIATFYSPLARFWELVAGGLLAFFMLAKSDKWARLKCNIDAILFRFFKRKVNLNNLMALIGISTLAFGFMKIDKHFVFPGSWAMLPVFGTLAVIASGPSAWLNRFFLSNPLMVWVGLVSFPLYLWHWPLLSFARIIEGQLPTAFFRVVILVLSVVLAWVTYTLIERPIRFGQKIQLKSTGSSFVILIIGLIGYITFKRGGFPFRVEQYNKISEAAGEWGYPGKLQQFTFNNTTLLFQKSHREDTTLFVGDSNVEQYYVRADELMTSQPTTTNSVVFVTGGGCLPVPGSPHDDAHKHCIGMTEAALHFAQRDPNVRNIVIGASWNGYLTTGNHLAVKIEPNNFEYRSTLSRLTAYLKQLIGLKKRVFLVLNIPQGNELDPKFMVQRSFENFPKVF